MTKSMSTPLPVCIKQKVTFNCFLIFRLIDADTCPGNGSRDSNCACHRDHPDEGYTMFEKVRFDVSNMRVIGKQIIL